jgi:signal transduction histidine kinase
MSFLRRKGFHRLFAMALVAATTLLIAGAQLGPVDPFMGSKVIQDGTRCDNTGENCIEISLPERVVVPDGSDSLTVQYRFLIRTEDFPEDTPALFIERLRDSFEVRVNGALISAGLNSAAHMWNRPQFMLIPRVLLQPTENEIEIRLHSFATGPIRLEPFHIGRAYPLSYYNNLLTIHRVGLCRIGLGLSICLFFMFLGLRLFGNAVDGNGYLVTANAAAIIFLAKGSYIYDPLPHQIWATVWASAIFVYLFAMIRIVGIWTGTRARRIETVFAITAIVGTALHLVLAPQFWPILQTVMALAAMAAGFPVLQRLVELTILNERMKDAILLALVCVSFGIGIVETLDLTGLLGPALRGAPQVVPLLGFIAIITALMSQLLQSRAQANALMAQLNAQVIDRTSQLTAKSAEVDNLVAKRARDQERERILLDLHDGIGGQLVSMLAYLNRTSEADPVIQDGMQAALTDLALMMDSLESRQSVTSLLGSLRDRIEPMLLKNGITFDWQIKNEPAYHQSGPTRNLSLLRIVQEAITNTLKHAEATRIRVECDTDHISIIDNGVGFDPKAQADAGRGLHNMHRRAREIDARLSIERHPGQTVVRLEW